MRGAWQRWGWGGWQLDGGFKSACPVSCGARPPLLRLYCTCIYSCRPNGWRCLTRGRGTDRLFLHGRRSCRWAVDRRAHPFLHLPPLADKAVVFSPLSRAGVKELAAQRRSRDIFIFFIPSSAPPYFFLPSFFHCRESCWLPGSARPHHPATFCLPTWGGGCAALVFMADAAFAHTSSRRLSPPQVAEMIGPPRSISMSAPSVPVYSCIFRSRRAVPAACTCKSRRACVRVWGFCVCVCVCVCVSVHLYSFWGADSAAGLRGPIFPRCSFWCFFLCFLDGCAASVRGEHAYPSPRRFVGVEGPPRCRGVPWDRT